MKNRLIRLFLGVFILVCLPLALSATPSTVHAATKKMPVTKMITTPEAPKGQNQWFTSVTLIEFDSCQSCKTYFQWNSVKGDWKLYKAPLRAWRGENVLYYYSVNKHGVKEAIKSRTIKVDYEKPVINGIKTESVNGQAKISWQSQTDVAKFLIYERDNKTYRYVKTVKSSFFTDKDVEIGKTYVYGIVAVDQAGFKSKMMQAVVKVVKPEPVIQPVQSKAVRSIGKGESVAPATRKEEVSKPEQKEVVIPVQETSEKPKEKSTTSTRDWSRLLVAISIMVIAAGAAIGGYYSYEWWIARQPKEEKTKEKKSNSRW